MSIAENAVRKYTGLNLLANRRFKECTKNVHRSGRRPYSNVSRFPDGARLREAEAEQGREGEALGRTERQAIRAIRRVARQRGIEVKGAVPLAVEVGSFLFVVALDERDDLRLVAVPLDRVIRLD